MADPNVQEKINSMQLVQQNMENSSMQRQQFQMQQAELDSALEQLGNDKAYKIIGNIMVATDTVALKTELEEKKKILEIRISTLEKQEAKLREKAESLQKEVLESLEKKNGNKQTKA